VPEVGMDGVQFLSPEFQKAFQMAQQAERKPIESLERRKGSMSSKVELLNEVLGKIDGVKKLLPPLGTPVAFREFAVTADDPKVVTGSANKGVADPGKYGLEVMRLAKSASAVTNRFEDKDKTHIGTGYIRFSTMDGSTKDLFVDNENATLDGVARLINNSRLGMKASVINDQSDPEAPYRLMLIADGVGSQNDVEYPEFYLVDGEEDFFIDEEIDATNALIRYEGFEIESPTNEITDLIPGVTLSIRGTTDPGKPTAITVEQDIPKTTIKVKNLVENLNQVFGFIQQQNTLDEKSKTMDSLGGDYGIRAAEQRLKQALSMNFLGFDGIDRNVKSLGDIGIQFNRNGTLEFDEKKFENVLESHYHEVTDFLTGDGTTGIIPRLSHALNSMTRPGDGLLSNQKMNYSGQMSKIDTEIATKEKQAGVRVEKLKERLAKAQGALSSMEKQGAFFQGQPGGA